jgi:hypothetical protein
MHSYVLLLIEYSIINESHYSGLMSKMIDKRYNYFTVII